VSPSRSGVAVTAALVGAASYAWLARGPTSLYAEYRRRAAALPTGRVGPSLVDADLADLPTPVRTYVRRSGAVGRPRVTTLRARIHGRIRSGVDAPWMPFTGEQVDRFGPTPTRLFRIDASRAGLPVDVLHVYDGGSATMRVRLCSLVPLVAATGEQLHHTETVTVFNDLCVLAPAALVDAPIAWEVLDAHRVRGTYAVRDERVRADLVFDDAGDLVDFVSDDRRRLAPDGVSSTVQRWSTPLGPYRSFGGRRIAASGDGCWHAGGDEGTFAYIEFAVDDIRYDGDARVAPAG
jgi:hypothetical protein